MNNPTTNGGFPPPWDGDSVLEVTSRHPTCAGETHIRLPRELSLRAVRRVVCSNCSQLYEARNVRELAPSAPARTRLAAPALPMPAFSLPAFNLPTWNLPALPMPAVSLPQVALPAWVPPMPSIDWRLWSLPVAALAVFLGLQLFQGDPAPEPASVAEAPAARADVASPQPNKAKKGDVAKAGASAAAGAELVREPSFSVALPAGWDRVAPSSGATFAAVAPDGTADATLWVQNDPKLDFATFEANSLVQLEGLVGSSEVVERNAGPNLTSSSIKIAPVDVPKGAPTYEVVLRGNGQNWYYLATTLQPDASADAASAVELVQGSFLPTGAKK